MHGHCTALLSLQCLGAAQRDVAVEERFWLSCNCSDSINIIDGPSVIMVVSQND